MHNVFKAHKLYVHSFFIVFDQFFTIFMSLAIVHVLIYAYSEGDGLQARCQKQAKHFGERNFSNRLYAFGETRKQ